MKNKQIRLRVLYNIFFLLGFIAAAQNLEHEYIAEFHRLVSKDRDSAIAYCNILENTNSLDKRGFSIAGKAYAYALRSNYIKADSLFKKTQQFQVDYNLINDKELNGNINYLRALLYVETHEFETALNILNQTINSCKEECSFMLDLRLLSAIGRVYSMSKNNLKAIDIGKKNLRKIKNNPAFSTDFALKKEYVKTLVINANRHINFFEYPFSHLI